MSDPITAAVIVGLAAQKFTEGAAGKSAEKLVERLWDSIVARFKGDKRAERAVATFVETKGEKKSVNTLAVYLEDELRNEDFRSELEAIVRDIQKAEPDPEATVNKIINSSGANAVNVVENSGTINYGVKN